MGDYTTKDFMDLKDKYVKYLTFIYNKNLNTSRDKEFSKAVQKLTHELFSDESLDDFSQSIATSFSLQYKLGYEISEILTNLRILQNQHIQGESQKKEPTVKDEYIKFLGMNTKLLKSSTIFEEHGEEISRSEFNYDFSLKTVMRLLKAKTDQEKIDVFYNEFQSTKRTQNKEIRMTTQIIDMHENSEHKWFKALVRYQSRHEFSIYLEQENADLLKKTDEKNKPKQVKANKPDKIKSIVKWTNGINKNDFVKLIYAMHEARLINSGNGEITKIVEALAPIFDIELNDWQSNFSKGLNVGEPDFNTDSFFDKLKNSYLDYQKKNRK